MKIMKKIIITLVVLFSLSNIVYADDKFLFDAYYQLNLGKTSYAEKAASSMQNKKYKKAEKYIQKSINLDLKDKQYLTYLVKGSLEINKNNIDEAEKDFKKAIDYLQYNDINDTPINSYMIYNGLAKVYLAKKDYQQALEYSDKAFESPYLEKEFIETRIDILKQGNFDKKPFKYSNTIQCLNVKLEAFIDDAKEWQKMLDWLATVDKTIQENGKFTYGEEIDFSDKQIKSAEIKKEKLCSAYLQKSTIMYLIAPTKYKDIIWKYMEDVLNNQNCLSNQVKSMANGAAAEMQECLFDNKSEAISYYNTALSFDKNNHDLHQRKAILCIDTEQFSECEQDINFIMNDNPQKEDYVISIYYHLGLINDDNFNDNADKVIYLCNKGIGYFPDEQKFFKDMKKTIEDAKKKYEKAKKEYEIKLAKQQKQEAIQREKERQEEIKRQKWLQKRPNESWLYYFKRTGQDPLDYLLNFPYELYY